MGFADQQLQVPYSPDDTFNALKAAMEKLPKVKVDSASPTNKNSCSRDWLEPLVLGRKYQYFGCSS